MLAKDNWWVIHPFSMFRRYWDVFLMGLLLYIALLVPFVIGFEVGTVHEVLAFCTFFNPLFIFWCFVVLIRPTNNNAQQTATTTTTTNHATTTTTTTTTNNNQQTNQVKCVCSATRERERARPCAGGAHGGGHGDFRAGPPGGCVLHHGHLLQLLHGRGLYKLTTVNPIALKRPLSTLEPIK
jgi:hypothetical protein